MSKELRGAERWRRTKQIYLAALEQDQLQRPKFIARSCGGDASLQREVERLLAAQEIQDDFLEPVVQRSDAGAESGHSAGRLIGQRIGSYELTEFIATGGMGEVYRARRADGQFSSDAAIKIIRPGLATDDLLSRFRAERQTLASLNHPNIARLLDGGATADGRPFLVMEFVEGLPLDVYCDQQGCSIAQRLQLFLKVCEAVHYAHQNLIVHRDLKPGNILVAADGVPKLLDFGIAKLLDSGGRSQPVTAVDDPLRFLTPEYASPEHVLGEGVTTASDVYSLGVILYELLTGRRPYRLENRRPREIERAICETDPKKPSSLFARPQTRELSPARPIRSLNDTHGCGPGRLRRELSGDLDKIVLMAMHKKQDRRYASAQQLSEDIRRHLESEPVIARQDTLGYRAATFVRRNRYAVSGALALLIALVAGVFGTTWQRNQALAHLGRAEEAEGRMTIEARRARTEAEAAGEVAEFLVDLFRQSHPSVALGNTITARELLDRGASKIASGLTTSPETRATLMDTIGVAYQSLGLLDRAERQLTVALEVRRECLVGEHEAIATSLDHLGSLRFDRGEYDAAQSLQEEALSMRRSLFGSEHLDVALSLNNLGAVHYGRGDFQTAIRLSREALAMRRRLLGDDHLEVAQSLNNLAALLRATGNYEEAELFYREALATRERLLGDRHPDVAQSLNNLAVLLLSTQRYAEAEVRCRESLAMRRELLGPDHPETVQSLDNLGGILQAQGKLDEAEQHYRAALLSGQQLLGTEHPEIAVTLNNLAMVLLGKGQNKAAEPLLRQCLRIKRKTHPEGHWRVATAESALGTCLSRQGKYEEAEPLLVSACPIVRGALGARHVRTLKVIRSAAELYRAWGRPEAAAPYLEALRQSGSSDD